MEQENKKTRSKYDKKERARLIRMAETAYNSDPRIKKEKELVEAEKLRKKQEKKDIKIQEALKREQFEKDI